MIKLGTGAYTYEWIGDFCKLPKGKGFGYTHGVVTDKNDNVYVHNSSTDGVCVFDRDGNFLRSWGPQFEGGAHGMFLSVEGGKEYLYFADVLRLVVEKYTLDGEKLWSMGRPPRDDIYKEEKDFKPTDVCVAPDGSFYVMDGYGKPWVHRYTKDAKYIDSFGGPGKGEGQLACPHGGWVDTRRGEPELYIADRGNNRIQVFTLDGKHKRFITEEQNMPCCFFEFKGDLYIPDLKARVTILDKNDKLVTHLGEAPEIPATPGWPNIQYKMQPGKFSAPHACCVDSHGDIYVAEWISSGRVTKLKRVR
jgi:hypothetical protein